MGVNSAVWRQSELTEQNALDLTSKMARLRRLELDEIVEAHRAVGGSGRGRRHATEQVNHAYAVLLSSQFQGFCRDLHSECARHIVQQVPVALRNLLGGGS